MRQLNFRDSQIVAAGVGLDVTLRLTVPEAQEPLIVALLAELFTANLSAALLAQALINLPAEFNAIHIQSVSIQFPHAF